jgi:hypothetical protein
MFFFRVDTEANEKANYGRVVSTNRNAFAILFKQSRSLMLCCEREIFRGIDWTRCRYGEVKNRLATSFTTLPVEVRPVTIRKLLSFVAEHRLNLASLASSGRNSTDLREWLRHCPSEYHH